MKSNNKVINSISLIIVSMGVILGITLLGLAVWGDFEASFYKPAQSGKKNLHAVSCPVFITEKDKSVVTTIISNPIDKKISPTVWTIITEGSILLQREIRNNYVLQPGEKLNLSWPITASDAAFGNLILAKVYIYSQSPLPASHGTCGIVVLHISSLSGSQVFTIALLASLLFMASGIALWYYTHQPLIDISREVATSMIGISFIVLLGLIAIFPGWWLVGGVIFVISLLLISGIVSHFILIS